MSQYFNRHWIKQGLFRIPTTNFIEPVKPTFWGLGDPECWRVQTNCTNFSEIRQMSQKLFHFVAVTDRHTF